MDEIENNARTAPLDCLIYEKNNTRSAENGSAEGEDKDRRSAEESGITGFEGVGDEEDAAGDEDEVGGVSLTAGVDDGVFDMRESLAANAEVGGSGLEVGDGQPTGHGGLGAAPWPASRVEEDRQQRRS